MFSLKVKTSKSSPIACNGRVNGESSFQDLKLALYDVTSIPVHQQKILVGFPPRKIEAVNEAHLKNIGIQHGDVIIVEETPLSTNVVSESSVKRQADTSKNIEGNLPQGCLIRQVVPSDNSCLFASIYFLVNGGQIDRERLQSMREIVARTIRAEPDLYNEALLEKSNSEYCHWILNNTSWGGAIELSIFSSYYQIEIVALDAKTGLMNRFGEDRNCSQRIFLMYDGIHYDPLYLETHDGQQRYIFGSAEEWLLEQANILVQEAKITGDFTDTDKFLLVCNECGFHMHGEAAAVHHAKSTAHSNFSEVKEKV